MFLGQETFRRRPCGADSLLVSRGCDRSFPAGPRPDRHRRHRLRRGPPGGRQWDARFGNVAQLAVERVDLRQEGSHDRSLRAAGGSVAAEQFGLESGRRIGQREAESFAEDRERAGGIGDHLPELTHQAALGPAAGKIEEDAIGVLPGAEREERIGDAGLVEAPIERVGDLPRAAEDHQPDRLGNLIGPEVEKQERARILPAPRQARRAARGNDLSGAGFQSHRKRDPPLRYDAVAVEPAASQRSLVKLEEVEVFEVPAGVAVPHPQLPLPELDAGPVEERRDVRRARTVHPRDRQGRWQPVERPRRRAGDGRRFDTGR